MTPNRLIEKTCRQVLNKKVSSISLKVVILVEQLSLLLALFPSRVLNQPLFIIIRISPMLICLYNRRRMLTEVLHVICKSTKDFSSKLVNTILKTKKVSVDLVTKTQSRSSGGNWLNTQSQKSV